MALREERYLEQKFGAPYLAYKESVPRQGWKFRRPGLRQFRFWGNRGSLRRGLGGRGGYRLGVGGDAEQTPLAFDRLIDQVEIKLLGRSGKEAGKTAMEIALVRQKGEREGAYAGPPVRRPQGCTSSTRRFCARPSSLALEATGARKPTPAACMRAAATP